MYIDPKLIGNAVKIQAFPKRGDVLDIDKMEYHMGVLEAVSVTPTGIQLKFVGVSHILSFSKEHHSVELWPI